MAQKPKLVGKIKPSFISRTLRKVSFTYKGKKYSSRVIKWKLIRGKAVPYVMAGGKALRVDLS